MKKKLLTVLLITAMATFTLTGCGGKSSSTSTTKTGDNTVHFGGTSAVVTNVDPAIDWNGWYPVRYGVAETLFKLNDQLQPSPWLAESFENIDPTTWKIVIKEKATFSNGEKVTGEKVIASLKRVGSINKRAKILGESTYTSEGNTITVKTPIPYTAFINDLCDPYASIVDVDGTKDFEKSPICTGPFVMSEFEPETKAVMVKNDKYWDGTPKVDKVEYVKVSDFDTLAMSLQTGEVDIALDLSPESAKSLEGKDNLIVTKTVQPRVYQIYFNLDKMQDKAVREAIMYGINKKAIGDDQLKGAMTPTVGAFTDNTPFNGKNLKARDFNTETSKKLLMDAGYKDTDGDGIVEKDGKPLSIQLNVYKRLAMESIATEIQAELKMIGIDVKIEVSEKATYFDSGNFEMGIYSIVTTPTGDPYTFLKGSMQKEGVANFGHYDNSEVQKKIAELSETFDIDKRITLVQEIQQLAIDDAAYDYVGFNNMMTAMSSKISGYVTTANDYYQTTKDLEKK